MLSGPKQEELNRRCDKQTVKGKTHGDRTAMDLLISCYIKECCAVIRLQGRRTVDGHIFKCKLA